MFAGTTYQFLVISADEAGNVTTNDNNGTRFSFVAVAAKTALLVNAYTPDTRFGTTEIPVTDYTDALDQSGLSYEVWEVSNRGSPGTNDLRPFRLVIWRLNDNPLATDTLDPSQQAALQNYVKSGGSIFISSMELLSRLGDVPFRTNVLQVQAFNEDAGVEEADGSGNDFISSGMALRLDYSVYDSDILQLLGQSPDVSDTLVISTNAAPIFYDSPSGNVAGLRYPRIDLGIVGGFIG